MTEHQETDFDSAFTINVLHHCASQHSADQTEKAVIRAEQSCVPAGFNTHPGAPMTSPWVRAAVFRKRGQ